MSIVGVLQLVRGQLESEDLFVDLGVGTAGVHINLRVLFLSSQTLACRLARVCSTVATVPAVLFHAVLASSDLGVLTEDLRKPGPEAAGVLHLGDDVSHQGVDQGFLLGLNNLINILEMLLLLENITGECI